MSLDGYVAGPEQSPENPLGVGGMQLHDWAFGLAAWRAPHGLAAGRVDEVNVSLVPVLLGGGERLFDGLGDARLELEQVRVVEAPGVTHLRYRVRRGA
jgi:hypothetical protein